MVCRDGSATYAEAVRQGAADAIQIGDRWHIWNNLIAAVEKTVTAHSTCWYGEPRPQERALQRHAAIHDLLDQGVGLLECARRLGVSFNTVKRYARIPSTEQLRRPPPYRRSMVDPYLDHLRRRLVRQPDIPVTHLPAEIRALGYPGSANCWSAIFNKAGPSPTASRPRHGASSPGSRAGPKACPSTTAAISTT